AARATLSDDALGELVRSGRSGADCVEAELARECLQSPQLHPGSVPPMLAVRIHDDGGPEVLVLEEVPDPVAGPGEVLVRIHASALNHLDVWIRKGLPSVPKPRILGADGAGIVEMLGDGVSGFEPAQPVVI